MQSVTFRSSRYCLSALPSPLPPLRLAGRVYLRYAPPSAYAHPRIRPIRDVPWNVSAMISRVYLRYALPRVYLRYAAHHHPRLWAATAAHTARWFYGRPHGAAFTPRRASICDTPRCGRYGCAIRVRAYGQSETFHGTSLP